MKTRHPERSAPPPPRWSLRALVLAWTVPVVLGTPVTILSFRGQPVALWRVMAIVGATWYVWVAMTFPVVFLADQWRLERPLSGRAVAIHLAGALAACAVQALTITIATMVLAPPGTATLIDIFIYWILLLAPGEVVIYAAVVGLRTAQIHRAESAARERRAQQLAAQLSEAKLAALRSQLQPHFLFNTLNAVIALVRDHQTDDAVAALTTLSALLRTALRTGSAHEVTLGEELTFTTNYLAIEQLRFGDRLSVRVDVPSTLTDARVPSFLLQPFVENAVKHGLRQRPSGGRVDISARDADDRLIVRVEDDGAGLAADWEQRCASGFGIANSRARLRQLYGADASLSIRCNEAKQTVVELALPLRRTAVSA